MPVGRVVYHHLFPLSFREFLQALSPNLLKYLDQIGWESEIPQSAHLKSLHQYSLQKGGKIAFRFDMNQPGRQELEPSIRIGGTQNKTGKVAFSLISLPLYAVEELNRICDQIDSRKPSPKQRY